LKEDEDTERLDPAMLGCTDGPGSYVAVRREPLCAGSSADGGSGRLGASRSNCHTLQGSTWSGQGVCCLLQDRYRRAVESSDGLCSRAQSHDHCVAPVPEQLVRQEGGKRIPVARQKLANVGPGQGGAGTQQRPAEAEVRRRQTDVPSRARCVSGRMEDRGRGTGVGHPDMAGAGS
jgi:hypothetical protein